MPYLAALISPAPPLAAVPPTLVSIPAVFVLTLLIAGLRRQRDVTPKTPATLGTPTPRFGPVLGVTGLLIGVGWVVQAQATLWPLLTSTDPSQRPGPLLVLQYVATFRQPGPPAVAALTPIPVLIMVITASVLLQVFGLARLTATIAADRAGSRPQAQT